MEESIPSKDNNNSNSENVSKEQRGWTPNKERKVKSKKAYDQARMEHLLQSDSVIYKGELDRDREETKRGDGSDVKLSASSKGHVLLGDDFQSAYHPSKASPGRLAALFATQEVRKRNAYAQKVIEATIDSSRLSSEDRSFATLLVLGVVSTWGTLDDIINRAINSPRDIKPDVRDALRISTYEIYLLNKAPHAALDQGVELVRAVAPSAAGLGNAVLHRILNMQPEFPFGDPKTDISALARYYAFPSWMAKMLIQDLGNKDACALMAAAAQSAPLFIAVNALKADDAEVMSIFANAGCELEPAESGGVVPLGCYKINKPRVLADGRIRRLFNSGQILVADASSQAIAYCALEEGKPDSLLEIGAGVGTKSILLQNAAHRLYSSPLHLECIDSYDFKTSILKERASTYDVPIAHVYTGNATRLDRVIGSNTYDRIFIDAPCSGLGTLRRHQEIRWRITQEDITTLADQGFKLLLSASKHVSVGGTLIYSTCTVTHKENIELIRRFLASEQGKSFALIQLAGKACFQSFASKDLPDAHFAVKLARKA